MVGHNVWRSSTTERKQPQMCMGAGFLAHSTPELASSPCLRQFHRSDRGNELQPKDFWARATRRMLVAGRMTQLRVERSDSCTRMLNASPAQP